MAQKLLNNLGNQVSTRTISWEEQVIRVWGSDFRAPDRGIYEFSGGRKFDSTDRGNTGIYNSNLGPGYVPKT
jgi:hypothetical protein